jgi:type 1 glutamine amidotransferase
MRAASGDAARRGPAGTTGSLSDARARALALAVAVGLGFAGCGGGGDADDSAATTKTPPAVATTTPTAVTTIPTGSAEPSTAPPEVTTVVVLTRTAGFRHTSIEPAAAALVDGLSAMGMEVVVDPDAARVTDDGLIGVDAVVLLSTTGDWLDDDQQSALERWAAAGGGIAGVHAATDAEPNWVFLEAALGTRFAGHPPPQTATVVVEDGTHPATAGLPTRWTVTDEWYEFAPDPRGAVHVLASVDESTYAGGGMGSGHPVEWCRQPSAVAGRTWYTALGHPDELWADATFVAHVVSGVAWAAGALDGPCGS